LRSWPAAPEAAEEEDEDDGLCAIAREKRAAEL
jgi:hypothetical protein